MTYMIYWKLSILALLGHIECVSKQIDKIFFYNFFYKLYVSSCNKTKFYLSFKCYLSDY